MCIIMTDYAIPKIKHLNSRVNSQMFAPINNIEKVTGNARNVQVRNIQ